MSFLAAYSSVIIGPRVRLPCRERPSCAMRFPSVVGHGTWMQLSLCYAASKSARGRSPRIFGAFHRGYLDRKLRTLFLPYSGKDFSVPANVYIIGTMNTADRSIALMDTALRRRFTFREVMPDSSCLSEVSVDGVDIQRMLEVMNARIELLYDREHTLGHAYFLKLKDDPSIECLAGIFRDQVIPLLQEYFYDDYTKIRSVLGAAADAFSWPKKTATMSFGLTTLSLTAI